MSVEYGSEEYYEETGKNGLTVNTKRTEIVPAYDKKLFYLDSFFKRMMYTTVSRATAKDLISYSNFYYKDSSDKVYYWHRKRKSKYACMPGGSVIYIDAEASMERFTGYSTTYSVIEPWRRAPAFFGMLDGKAYFTVKGSSKFDDEDNIYIARSDDGLLLEPILKVPKPFDDYNDEEWIYRFYNWFRPNNKGKFGHFIIKRWRKDEDPNPSYTMRSKVYCNVYDGLNYHSNIIAQDMYGDGEIEEVVTDAFAKGELFNTNDHYPIYVYNYLIDRYAVGSSASYDPTKNTHNFCSMFSSSYILWIAYYWYRVYNANTGQTTDLPFVTHLDAINSLWRTSNPYEYRVINPKEIPITVLRCLGIIPFFDNLGTCPNGNILVSVIYQCDPRIPTYVGEMYPEYSTFSRFAMTPIYFVIDANSGEWIKSNVGEPMDYDTSNAQYSEVSINSNMRPAAVYSDDKYLWFRKPYREQTDITFYGTKDGYNIDKRITYYNRKSIQGSFHMMQKASDNKELITTLTIGNPLGGISGVYDSAFNPVPVFENGVFKQYMLCVTGGENAAGYSNTYNGLVEDLKPDNYGVLQVPLVAISANGQRYDRYRVRYTKPQPDQTDDDYVFNIE